MTTQIRDFFKRDLEKYYQLEAGETAPSLRNKTYIWMTNQGFHCVAVYRFGQFARRLGKKHPVPALPLILLHKAASYFISTVYHVNINNANIAAGLYICHVGTIYIGACDIGENFSITHNVTIGRGHSLGREGVPRVGNNVWIGTGSTIFGDIVIGNDVTIGSGSVVSRSIPDRCLVNGNPGKVILQGYDNSNLFGNCNGV